MPAPNRFYKIECNALEGLDFPTLGVAVAGRPYVTVTIDGRLVGRTELLDRGRHSYSFSGLAIPWARQVRFSSDLTTVTPQVVVRLFADRGDQAPAVLLERTGTVEIRFEARPRSIDHSIVIGGGATLSLSSWSVIVPVAPGAPGRAVVTTITRVRGLSKPGHVPMVVDAPKRAEYCQGYRSEDDLGRVYLSRALDGAWAASTERIELTAQVEAFNPALPRPTGVRWQVRPVADPTLMRLDVHREAQAVLRTDDQAHWAGDRWAGVEGYALRTRLAEDDDEDDDAAETAIDGDGVSRVCLICPSVAGDHFAVAAAAAGEGLTNQLEAGLLVWPIEPPSFNVGDQTGAMTMWHRIDVEHRAMTGTLDLPYAEVAQYLEPACIQLDFAPRVACRTSRDYLGRYGADIGRTVRQYANKEFGHRRDGGWFCVIGVRQFLAPPQQGIEASSPYVGHWELRHHQGLYKGWYYDCVDVSPDDADNAWEADRAYFEWRDDQGDEFKHASFAITQREEVAEGWVRCWLDGREVVKRFDGAGLNGLNAYAHQMTFSPTGYQDRENGLWHAGSFAIPAGVYHADDELVRLRLGQPGDFTYSGWSPDLFHDHQAYFAGRLVIATHDHEFVEWDDTQGEYVPRADCVDNLVITIVHELTHGFGLPHRCCEWDHRTPRERTCVMNYSEDWVVTPDGAPQAGTTDRVGRHFCALHISELRKVRLERNPALAAAWRT